MFSWLKNKLQNGASDQLLIQKIQHEDKEAFGLLYLRYIDSIYRYIYFRMGQDKPVAEDLSEIVFLKAWKSIYQLKKDNLNFRSWLYTIAHNTCVDHFRQSRNQVKLEENTVHTDLDFEKKLINEENISDLQHALMRLTDEQKQVITMKYIEEMSNEEISKILNKSEDAIRAIQHRGLKKLRILIKK